MKVNCNKIKGRMRELQMTHEDVVAAMNEIGQKISRASLNNKLGGKTEFKIGEFTALMKVLEVDDFTAYVDILG